MNKQFYTTQELAEVLMVDEATVLTYIKKGKIKAIKLGRIWRIPVSAVAYLLEGETK